MSGTTKTHEDLARRFYTGAEVKEITLPEIGFWWGGLIPKQGIVLLHGKFGTFKTPLTMTLAKAMASGTDCWEHPSEKTKVLYVEADTPMPGIWPRLHKINPDIPGLDFFFCYPGFDIVNPGADPYNTEVLKELGDVFETGGYGVVFIDSLRTVHTLPEKENESPSRVYRAAAHLFAGATVVFVHHDRKSSPDWRSNALASDDPDLEKETFSGAQAWINLATTSAKIQREATGTGENKKDYVRLIQTKSQVGEVMSPLNLKVSDGVHLTLLSEITKDSIIDALSRLTQYTGDTRKFFKSERQMDAALAEEFGCSREWLKKKRKQAEEEHGIKFR